MNATQLLSHFDRLAEAPGAVPRLRRFILDLAVRGKLVEQDAGDEPAQLLLKRVASEKSRLALEGLTKQKKSLANIALEDIPFALPGSWVWTRLQEVTSYMQRGKSPSYAATDGAPVISQKCVQWRGLDLGAARRITLESLEKYEQVRFLQNNDLLWNSTGTGTIGRIVRVLAPSEKLVCDSHVTVVRCALVNSEYVRSWLATDHVYGSIEDRAAGATNQVELNSSMAALQVVPLPPLAEQHRIVAKVDELMALCDQLEAAQQERERRRDRLASASLQRLNQPAEANPTTDQPESTEAHQQAQREQQKDHARFHLQNLDLLIARPEHLAAIRATILQLAVTGYLVACDARDESASSLLGQVAAGRTVRRKIAQLNVEELETALLAIPPNWTWTVIDQIAADDDNAITDGPFGANLKTEHYIAQSGYRVIRLQNIGHGIFRDEHYAFVDAERFHRLSKHRVRAGDLVVAGLVDPAVRCAELPPNIGPALVKADCYRFAVAPSFSSRFALHYLNSPACQEFALVHHHGMTLTRIGLGNFRRIPFPVPPLAEQHRIVAKVDELMALCDQLEAQLTQSQTDSRRLLEAVLEAAIA